MAAKDKAQPGHNSVAGDRLKSFVERIERLNEEKRALVEDVREVFIEVKSAGFEVKAVRAIIRERAQDADDLKEHLAIVEIYKRSLGMLADTALGQAAIERVAK